MGKNHWETHHDTKKQADAAATVNHAFAPPSGNEATSVRESTGNLGVSWSCWVDEVVVVSAFSGSCFVIARDACVASDSVSTGVSSCTSVAIFGGMVSLAHSTKGTGENVKVTVDGSGETKSE